MPELDIKLELGPVMAQNVSSAVAGSSLVAGPCILVGWSLRETTGAAIATAEFLSGQLVIAESGIPAGLSDTKSASGSGVYCPAGISLGAVTGAFTGCIYRIAL